MHATQAQSEHVLNNRADSKQYTWFAGPGVRGIAGVSKMSLGCRGGVATQPELSILTVLSGVRLCCVKARAICLVNFVLGVNILFFLSKRGHGKRRQQTVATASYREALNRHGTFSSEAWHR